MVQFGKTEHTTNNTTHNQDSADRRIQNTTHTTDASRTSFSAADDHKHQEYFSSKDIFNTVNNYQNVNMSVLVATMALSVVAPIINGLISKAINKWNHDVPENMQELANQEFDLIHGKCLKMMSNKSSTSQLKQRISDRVTSTDFLFLQEQVNNYMKSLLRNASDDIIEGIIKKDKDQISAGESLLRSIKAPFNVSFESHVKYTTAPEQIGIFQYDQAIAALNRVLPSAMVGDSTTILVRKMVPIHYMHMNDSDISRLSTIFDGIYDFSTTEITRGNTNVYATPIIGHADLETVSILYNVDLTQISNAHFFSSCQNGDPFITKDSNFSGKAILETKLGHSMSVLGETVNEVADVMMDVLRRKNPNEDIQHSYRRVEKEPWYSGRSTRQFGNLMNVFSMKDESDIINTDKDFRTLSSLIQMIGTIKKLYPELLPRQDPQMKAFIRRCRMETERINQGFQMSSSPEPSVRSSSLMKQKIYPMIEDVPAGNFELSRQPSSIGASTMGPGGMTSLDHLLTRSELSGYLPNCLRSISEIKSPQLKQLRGEFKDIILKVTKISKEGEQMTCNVIINNSEKVREEMKSIRVKNSKYYEGQVWHVRGSCLFDEVSMFYKVIFE